MTRAQLTFAAAFSRLLLGTAAIILLPVIYPGTRDSLGPLLLYVVIAFGEQLLVWKQKGGRARTFAGGIVDALVISFVVHLVGSTQTVLPSLYVLTGVLNALVGGRRMGAMLAAVQVLAYACVVTAEHLGWLLSAPGVANRAAVLHASFESSLSSIVLVGYLVVTATAVVGFLAKAVEVREMELLRANAKLEDLSQRDPLTGLYNRRHLFARLEHEVARHRRGRPLALVMLDLDRFKAVNDSHGHLGGDQLLRELGKTLNASTRVVDVVARYGGDEFVLLLPDTEEGQARVVAERVVAAVHALGQTFAPEAAVTASLGMAIARADDTPSVLIRRADENAYRAKRSGGDRVMLDAPEKAPENPA